MKRPFNHKKLEIFIYILSILIYIAYIIYVYASMDETRLNKVFNSDALYLPTFFQDIFIDKTGFDGLRFNGQPNFFPDMIVYFIIYSISRNFILSTIIYSVIQNLFLIFIVFLLSKQIIKKFNYYYPAFINLLFVLILMSGIFGNFLMLRFHLISNGYHTSAFLLSLTVFYLFLRYVQTKKKKTLIFFAVLIFLGTLNDKIFTLGAVLPLFFTSLSLFFFKFEKKTILKISAVITVALLLGELSYNSINNFTKLSFIPQNYSFSVDKTIASSKFATDYLTSLLLNFDYNSVFLYIGFLSFIFLFFKLIVQIKSKKFKPENLTSFLFKVFSVTFFGFIFFTPIFITGTFTVNHKIRYILFVFYFGLINLAFIISMLNSQKLIQILTGFLILFSLSFLVSEFSKKEIKSNLTIILNFKPQFVKELELIAEKEPDLKLGISNYWDARKTTLFNNKNLKVYASFYPELEPNVWTSSNKYWYFDKDTLNRKRIFNFIILKEKADTVHYIDFFGSKNLKLLNSGNSYILKVPDFYFERKTKQAKIL